MSNFFMPRKSILRFSLSLGYCLVLVVLCVPTTMVQATTTDNATDRALTSLTLSLGSIAAAVGSSTDIAPADKLKLYTQLAELGQAIIGLGAVSKVESGAIVTSDESGQLPLDDTDIHRVVIQLDGDTFLAKVSVYKNTSQPDVFTIDTQTKELTKSPNVSFLKNIKSAKERVVTELSEEYSVKAYQLMGATFVSTRNPIRSKPIASNSREAEELYGQFGVNSVVTGVTVQIRRNGASIEMTDDQNQSLVISVDAIEERLGRDEMGVPTTNARYNGKMEFFLLDDTEPISRDDDRIKPKIDSLSSNLTKEEMIDFLIDQLRDVPFAESIPDVDEKLFNFLLTNRSEFVIQENRVVRTLFPTSVAAQCITPSDTVVMNEFLAQSLLGLRVQHIVTKGLFSYKVPISNMTSGDSGCRNVRNYF